MYLHEPCQPSKKLFAKIGNIPEKGLPNTENRLPKQFLAVDLRGNGLFHSPIWAENHSPVWPERLSHSLVVMPVTSLKMRKKVRSLVKPAEV